MEKEVLYKYGRYIIVTIDNFQDEHGKIKDGYALYNTETDVVELEHSVLFFIIQKAIQFENGLRDVLKFTEEHLVNKAEKERGWGDVLKSLEPPKPEEPPTDKDSE